MREVHAATLAHGAEAARVEIFASRVDGGGRRKHRMRAWSALISRWWSTTFLRFDYDARSYSRRRLCRMPASAERFIGCLASASRKSPSAQSTYLPILDTVEEGAPTSSGRLKIFTVLNVPPGVAGCGVVRFAYHGSCAGARRRALLQCRRTPAPSKCATQEFDQGLLHTLLTLRDRASNTPPLKRMAHRSSSKFREVIMEMLICKVANHLYTTTNPGFEHQTPFQVCARLADQKWSCRPGGLHPRRTGVICVGSSAPRVRPPAQVVSSDSHTIVGIIDYGIRQPSNRRVHPDGNHAGDGLAWSASQRVEGCATANSACAWFQQRQIQVPLIGRASPATGVFTSSGSAARLPPAIPILQIDSSRSAAS